MPFNIIRNDITKVKADAIVNSANPEPVPGGGAEGLIYKAAGYDRLLSARLKIGNIDRGKAACTPAFDLKAKYIIHTVGPVWQGGGAGELEILKECYKNSLELAYTLGCGSVAFPLISSGAYGFPKDEALSAALSEIQKFLMEHEMLVTLVVYSREAVALSEKVIGDIDQFISDSYAVENHNLSGRRNLRGREDSSCYDICAEENVFYDPVPVPVRNVARESVEKKAVLGKQAIPDDTGTLEDYLKRRSGSFSDTLFKLIDERGLSDVTVYKSANVDRKVFSKIKTKKDYRPKKETAVAFAIALKLDIDTASDLLSTAGYALSFSNNFDLIIRYYLTKKIYDIYEINATLYAYGYECLGAKI